MIHSPRLIVATLALISSAFVHGQTVEFGNLQVVQNDSGNNTTSVTLTRAAGTTPNFSILEGNRGDYYVSAGTANDVTGGVMLSSVAQNGRDNTAAGDTIGLFYATSAVDHVGNPYANKYWLPVFRCAPGDEVNINVAAAWFSYSQWRGGLARNSTGANGGANDTLTASAGINLGTQFVDNSGGVSTVNLTSLGATSANGVLLVNHAKNEDNFALSRANADGTFTVWVHDNGVNSGTYEQDPVAFVHVPVADVGTKQLVALGRVNSDASTDVAGGTFNLSKGGTGQWYLTIAGQNNTTGMLIVSPEGGGTNTTDNVVSYEWDGTNSRWVIESRDLSGATTQPTLQDGGAAGEDMFSFAFFEAPIGPVVAITSPASGSMTAPATFTVEVTATDADGTITQVEFLRNNVVIGTDATAPYTVAQNAVPAGSYTYVARATDNSGNTVTSDAVNVTVVFDPNNIPANTAVWFDGVNDYVTMGVAPELNTGNPQAASSGFTLECWFRKDGAGRSSGSGSGGVTGVPLFGKGRGESDGGTQDCNYFFGINSAGQLVADFESYSTGQNYPITATNTPIVNGQWYHAAVTYDSATFTWTMYLDGVSVGTASAALGALPRYDSVQHFGIGAAFNTAGVAEGAFAGTIDEVRVWNYARSAAEIAATRTLEIGDAPVGLLGRFGLNEGTGVVTASTAGSSVGTLTNGPLWVDGAPFTISNTPPSVTLTAPMDNATSTMPYPVTFEATALDNDGTIAKVEFLVDGVTVGEDTVLPYSYDWTPAAVGTYAVSARAVDNLGANTTSATATLHIVPNPNQPPVVTPISPADDASITGTSANLQVDLDDPEDNAMTVTFYGRYTTPETPGPDFTFIAIPDTQYYSEGSPSRANTVTVEQLIATFGAQTQWVLDNKATRNIAFVSHMGDIVEHGNNGGNDIEWQRASAAMGRLEHPVNAMRAHGVPFGCAPGNHDIDPIGDYDNGSTTFYNQFFNLSRFQYRNYWGGNFGADNTNNYQLFSASGLDFIVIHMAYDTTPNQDILDWADALLKAHPHRRGIVTSHYIIGQGNPATFGAQGAGIYNNLKDNPNLFLLLCGHIHAEGRRSDVFEGRTVYSVLSDYQGLQNGGNGFLRTFTFSPANNRIRVESWSPTLNRAANSSDGLPHFDGPYDLFYNLQQPVTNWVPLATVNVPAGGTSASTSWSGLERGRNFEWYAVVTDSINNVSTPARSFSTVAGTPPEITLDAPGDGASVATPVTIDLAATANDPDGAITRVEFYVDAAKIGEDTTAPYSATWTDATPGSYKLSAVAVDDSGLTTLSNAATVSVVYGNFPPLVVLTAPTDGAAYPAPADVTLIADATDIEGQIAKVEFFSGTALLGEDTTAPFALALTDLPTGAYTFTVRATDGIGQTTTSDPVGISVFVEASAPNAANVSVGLFDLPTWTIAATSPSPRHFNLPGTDVGDLELRINSVSVPFNSGITLASNWESPATIAAGTSSQDNLCEPYANGLGNVFVSVLDNSNNNAASANPSTSEQTTGISVAFASYADGWTGASIAGNGTVTNSNLPPGVTIVKEAGAGAYSISGLSTAGNLLAFTNGDSGTLADNVVSVRVVSGRWVIDTRDNAGGPQDNDFSFVYLPPAMTGVFAGKITSAGLLSSPNASLAALGATITVSAGYCEITFGDGTLINPATAALFVVADSTIGGSNSTAADNLISWWANGNSFRVFTQDLPEIDGTFEAIDIRVAAIPFSPGSVPPLPANVVSRKAHAAGSFEIDLPLTGSAGIECRSGGVNNDYQVVLTFPSAVTFSGATATPAAGGTGSVSSTSRSPNGTEVTVNLTGVSNAQTIGVTLSDVNDGTNTGNLAVRMSVLVGDINGNGLTNATDTSLTQAQSGAALSDSNFRADVNANGLINATDASIVQSKSGTGLP